MKTVELLLGNAEDLLNSFIETAVQDVFDGRAKVNARRTGRLDQIVAWGREGHFDLVIVIPDNLFNTQGEAGCLDSVLTAIEMLRTSSSAILALPVCGQRRQTEKLLLKAGADCVLELPFDLDELKSAVNRLMDHSSQLEQPQPSRWSLPVPAHSTS